MCRIALAVYSFVCVTQYPLDTYCNTYCTVWGILNQTKCFDKFKSQLSWSWQNQGLRLNINYCQWKNSFISFILFFQFFPFHLLPWPTDYPQSLLTHLHIVPTYYQLHTCFVHACFMHICFTKFPNMGGVHK